MTGARASIGQRIARRVVVTSSGCWEWQGYRNPQGYGRINGGGEAGPNLLVHRAAYEIVVGPVPSGLVLDHLCRNRACCNPFHLEAVTHIENVRRGDAMARSCAHPIGDYYRRPSGRLVYCTTCRRERRRAMAAGRGGAS